MTPTTNDKPGAANSESEEQSKSDEYLNFESFAKKIFAVPLSELEEVQAKNRKARKRKPKPKGNN